MYVYKYVCITLAFLGGTLLLDSAVTKSATQWDLTQCYFKLYWCEGVCKIG